MQSTNDTATMDDADFEALIKKLGRQREEVQRNRPVEAAQDIIEKLADLKRRIESVTRQALTRKDG